MSNLKQSLNAEMQEKKERAKRQYAEAKEKMINRYEEFSQNTF